MFLGIILFEAQPSAFKSFISDLACGPPSPCRPLIDIAAATGN